MAVTGYTNNSKVCTCLVSVNINNDFGNDQVYMYYELTNYYQVRSILSASS